MPTPKLRIQELSHQNQEQHDFQEHTSQLIHMNHTAGSNHFTLLQAKSWVFCFNMVPTVVPATRSDCKLSAANSTECAEVTFLESDDKTQKGHVLAYPLLHIWKCLLFARGVTDAVHSFSHNSFLPKPFVASGSFGETNVFALCLSCLHRALPRPQIYIII